MQTLTRRAPLADPFTALREGSDPTIRVHADRVPAGALVPLHHRLVEARSSGEVMEAAVDSAVKDLCVDAAIVLLLEGDRVTRVACRGFASDLAEGHVGSTLSGSTPVADALARRAPQYFPDHASFHARYPSLKATAGRYQAHASLPLDGDGSAFGELFVSWAEPRAFAKQDEAVLEAFAALVAQSLWRARLLDARRDAEADLRQQRDLYVALLRAESDLGEGVLVTNAGSERRILYANDALARIAGVPIESLLGHGFEARSLLAPDATIEPPPARDDSASRHFRTRLKRPDGTIVHVEVASAPVSIDGALHRLSVVRDITPAVLAEETRRAQDSKIRVRDQFLTDATLQLLERALDPDETLRLIAHLCTQRLSAFASIDLLEGATRLRRVVVAHADPERAPLVERLQSEFPPVPRLRQVLEKVPRGEALVHNDLSREKLAAFVRAPEEMALMDALDVRHTLLVPLVGRSGLLGSMGLSRTSKDEPFGEEDVFVAKSLATRAALAYENARLNKETRTLEAQWRNLYERHQRILDTAPVQVLTIDSSGKILSINRTVRGDDPRNALALNAFDTIVEEDRERVRGIVLESIRTGMIAEYETQAEIAPGALRWFHVRVGPVDLDDRRGAILVSTDIDERKGVEREMAQVRAQLVQGEKLAALGTLVSGVAHELRTPLTYLANNTFLLEHRLNVAAREQQSAQQALDTVRPFLKEITGGVDRINLLVEDLRKYTKARQSPVMDVAPLDSLLSEAVELFRATNRGLHPLERSLSSTRPVRANRGAVQQLVLNLLQNAVEASPPGSSIRIVTRQDADEAVLEVVDRGAGIPADVQARMFEPLYTTKPDGTGLGLSIVKRIAGDHRATIRVASELGKGTTFSVRFPCA